MQQQVDRISHRLSKIVFVNERFRPWFPFFNNYFWKPTLVDVRFILLVKDERITNASLIESETLRARVVHMGMDNMVIPSP